MADIGAMIKSLREWFAKNPQEKAQDVAKRIPDPLMPHAGIEEARRRRAMMDKQTEE